MLKSCLCSSSVLTEAEDPILRSVFLSSSSLSICLRIRNCLHSVCRWHCICQALHIHPCKVKVFLLPAALILAESIMKSPSIQQTCHRILMDCGDILCACGNDARINQVAEQTDDTAVSDDRKLPCLEGTTLAMGDTGSFCTMDLFTIMQHSVFIILKSVKC